MNGKPERVFDFVIRIKVSPCIQQAREYRYIDNQDKKSRQPVDSQDENIPEQFEIKADDKSLCVAGKYHVAPGGAQNNSS
jgi:hypothetical protein